MIGLRMAKLRRRKGLTQGQLARRYDCSRQFLSAVELCKRDAPVALVALYIERCDPSDEERSALLEGLVMEQALKRRGRG